MSDIYVWRETLQVRCGLVDFIEKEVLDGLSVDVGQFWRGFSDLVKKHMGQNRFLLQERDRIQRDIDCWHKENGSATGKMEEYQSFLQKIGYLVDEPDDFRIATDNPDPEITDICGPQLVVPVSNARYALNAVNARWGSLYDALYGTDAIPREGKQKPGTCYNPERGQAVFDYVAGFMDKIFPLQDAGYGDVTGFEVVRDSQCAQLVMSVDGKKTRLQDPDGFKGYQRDNHGLHILLVHNGLHIELVVNHKHPVGKTHPAGLADVLVESAVTVIQDCEDSVAAVDVQDKIAVYRNWLGLMRADLAETFEKNGRRQLRQLNPCRQYIAADGSTVSLKGRALMMVRNVGHLMMSDAILDSAANPVGEGLMDGVITTLCAMHDMNLRQNSKSGAVYIVKPKMHGPREVAFAVEIFSDIEKMLGLAPNTIKIGIMDEERRTSANLKACIREALHRIFFINTGFLDRTGDEIHTCMHAGPVFGKDTIKSGLWIGAYEDRNVLTGLQCGFAGRAQIGKGMWAQPDCMHDMLAQKNAHPESGANCSWVPSPTAATLHALHYHYVNVEAAQKRRLNESLPPLSALFSMPVMEPSCLSARDIQDELDNNVQGILGYVVRWIDQGTGCSKVPDIHHVFLMEDRATCRISSQVIANWLEHGVVSERDVLSSFQKMAAIVDRQNADDPLYRSMAPDTEHSVAFQAALALVLEGVSAPSGYTEPVLHAFRRQAKQQGNRTVCTAFTSGHDMPG